MYMKSQQEGFQIKLSAVNIQKNILQKNMFLLSIVVQYKYFE